MVFDDSKYSMLPDDLRHEMKQLISIANCLKKEERRARVQVTLQKFAQRCFDVIDELSELYLTEVGDGKNKKSVLHNTDT